MGAFSALDKMKIDLLHGGLGLLDPINLRIIEGISQENQALVILSREKSFVPPEDLLAGQTKITLNSTEGLKQGREICLFDLENGEVKTIDSVQKDCVILSSPLRFSYLKEQSSLLFLRRISFFFAEEKQTLMRKTNFSPAQPLLEEVASFDFEYEKAKNLVKLTLFLKNNKEKKYETSVFPKNTGLLSISQAE